MSRTVEDRPVRVANCSGYHGDPAYEMYRQATLGDVDFITGDYLAEVNLANNATAWRNGQHPGYEITAWEGLQQTIDVIARKRIRVVINGGALDPKALALRVQDLVKQKHLSLSVAYLSGDDLYHRFGPNMPTTKEELQHLDFENASFVPSELTYAFVNGDEKVPMVSAHAYLGARGILAGLRRGADIIICGRVADASPVMAAAWFWHNWSETDYDQLAGSLIAGHLIECSAYVTGANFAGFDKFDLDNLVAPGFPIAEISKDGSCVITKHPGTEGVVNVDTVRCQFVYELQGDIYLNSDVSAYLGDVAIEKVGSERVRVHGIRGSPPPPTTKLAVFYQGGFEAELLLNATGYATNKKWDLLERQVNYFLPQAVINQIETLEFQRVGTPAINPTCQLESTTYMRIFIAAKSQKTVAAVTSVFKDISLKHFSGFHASLDTRSAVPRPFLAYYPALVRQVDIKETINFVKNAAVVSSHDTGHPPTYKDLEARNSYDPKVQTVFPGCTKSLRLGDIVLARSGDKGSNLNFGLFVINPAHWKWLQSYMTVARVKELLGKDWRDSFFIERVEFSQIHACHFVVYGILGRGVSSTSRLDGFGKGFADYIRDKVVEFPMGLL
ncbi:Ff.00g065850.m01.CDS01 [Fusarium sp. VM40]|nr:Ff.00g065850.m01.CDS01 [Fusarium sp. VM40]